MNFFCWIRFFVFCLGLFVGFVVDFFGGCGCYVGVLFSLIVGRW